MWIPGFGSDEIRPFKKACTTEAHKQVRPSPESSCAPGPPEAALTFGGGVVCFQRMALIRKTTKK